MTRVRLTLVAVVAATLALASCARAEAPANAPERDRAPGVAEAPTKTPVPDRTLVVAAAQTLIARTPLATLTTLDERGAPQSRIVEPFPIEEGEAFTIWIATNSATRKVREIERDPRVTVLYFDPQGPGYATLAGRAAIVRDPAEKAKRWKDSWAAFYKDKNRGDDYTLIRVTPERLEISSPSQNMNNDPATWRPVTIAIGKN